MKLITQPEDGIAPLIDTVAQAKKSIDVVIFRFDLMTPSAYWKRWRASGRGG